MQNWMLRSDHFVLFFGKTLGSEVHAEIYLIIFLYFLSLRGDSLISFDDDVSTPSQAASVNGMTSQVQAMSKS